MTESSAPFFKELHQSYTSDDLVSNLKSILIELDVFVGKVRFFGGYADVLDGTERALTDVVGNKVAIKRMRVHLEAIEREFARVSIQQ